MAVDIGVSNSSSSSLGAIKGDDSSCSLVLSSDRFPFLMSLEPLRLVEESTPQGSRGAPSDGLSDGGGPLFVEFIRR